MIRRRGLGPAAALVLVVALGGCGLRPLYGGGTGGAVAGVLAGVEVGQIEGQRGWLVGNALRDRMVAAQRGGGAAGRYRLDVRLDDQITGFGVRADDTVTRERRTLRARYQLVDLTSGQVVLDATAAADAGIDVVGSEFATIAAEQTALERLAERLADQMVARIARFAAGRQP